MRHTYECPMRWADMDLLGHVNNVTYLQYLAEARRAVLGSDGAAPVVGHLVEFRTPLVFRRAPVLVDTWVTEVAAGRVRLSHEIHDEQDGRRRVYVAADTVLALEPDEEQRSFLETLREEAPDRREPQAVARPARATYPVTVRSSDVDAAGHVTDVHHVELFQEARIQYLMDLHRRGQRWTHHVVARTDIGYHAPVALRPAAYDVHSWIGHLGTRSFTICSELRDRDAVLATAEVTMVTFDKETQRPAEMAPEQRERLQQELG